MKYEIIEKPNTNRTIQTAKSVAQNIDGFHLDPEHKTVLLALSSGVTISFNWGNFDFQVNRAS